MRTLRQDRGERGQRGVQLASRAPDGAWRRVIITVKSGCWVSFSAPPNVSYYCYGGRKYTCEELFQGWEQFRGFLMDDASCCSCTGEFGGFFCRRGLHFFKKERGGGDQVRGHDFSLGNPLWLF